MQKALCQKGTVFRCNLMTPYLAERRSTRTVAPISLNLRKTQTSNPNWLL